MRAGSEVSCRTLTKNRYVKPILCQLFQFVLDSTQRPRRIACEYFRIVETIEYSNDQNLTHLQVTLNDLKSRPDFSQCFQRPKSLGNRLGCGRSNNVEQPCGVRSASTDVRWLKAAEGIQNKKWFATFC